MKYLISVERLALDAYRADPYKYMVAVTSMNLIGFGVGQTSLPYNLTTLFSFACFTSLVNFFPSKVYLVNTNRVQHER